jgi:hypothetical protein
MALDLGELKLGDEAGPAGAAPEEMVHFWYKTSVEMESGALADNSHKTWLTGEKAFRSFLENELGLDPDQAWPETGHPAWTLVYAFVSFGLRGRGWKPNTVRTYLDSVSAVCRSRGVEDPTKHPRVVRVLKGLVREAGSLGLKEEKAAPLTEELMESLMLGLKLGKFRGSDGLNSMRGTERRQCMLYLWAGWAGLMRRGELGLLRVTDLHIGSDTVTVSIKHAKGDQVWEGATIELPKEFFGLDMGLVVLEHFAELEQVLGADFLKRGVKLFRHAAHPEEPWMDEAQAITAGLRRMLGQLGREDMVVKDYSSHSMRRGGAQFLRDLGVPRDILKAVGRWKSDAVDEYLKEVVGETRKKAALVFAKRSSPWKKVDWEGSG